MASKSKKQTQTQEKKANDFKKANISKLHIAFEQLGYEPELFEGYRDAQQGKCIPMFDGKNDDGSAKYAFCKASGRVFNDLISYLEMVAPDRVDQMRTIKRFYMGRSVGKASHVSNIDELTAKPRQLSVSRNEKNGSFIRVPYAALWFTGETNSMKVGHDMKVVVSYSRDAVIIKRQPHSA